MLRPLPLVDPGIQPERGRRQSAAPLSLAKSVFDEDVGVERLGLRMRVGRI
jgi:hypothetical protein